MKPGLLPRVCSILVLTLLAACMGPARPPVHSMNDVAGDEVLIVGRVELVPKLEKGEQKVSGRLRNKVMLLTGVKLKRFDSEPGPGDHRMRIEAIFDKTFFVASLKNPFYILVGELWMNGGDRVYFPGGLKVNVRPTDKAVYIGTLRYHRDEFFHFTKFDVIDDYERAQAEFRTEFGGGRLTKALAVPVKETK